MNVSCPECRSVFRIDPARVPATGVHARCSVCGAVISIEAAQPDVAPASVTRPAQNATEPDSRSVDPDNAPQGVAAPPTAAGDSGADVQTLATTAVVEAPSVREPLEQPASAAPAAPRARPVNPFLNNTPELRARRLARALVSDLVAYNPQKREQGLRDGTLRQLFRDEIRKSWEEYVDQVGASVAESTPHFQDALNDVLAGGRRVF